ncbi:sel1 repeat family protein [Salmonella enterica subsp. enterica serovar Java]|nr:sel1 repeat family protein [Salmonella enterica subsp. enterica serovar Java]
MNKLLAGITFIFLCATVDASNDYYSTLKKEASSGSVDAQYKLGKTYMLTSGDYSKAFYWLNKSAEQGNIEAQYNVGLLYYYGQGVKRNVNESIMWWRKASEAGHPIAQNDLAMMYKNETPITKCGEIVSLLNQSAKRGYELAYLNIGNLYSSGVCVDKQMREAIKWWEKASEKNNGQAEFNLAVVYKNGDGVIANSSMSDMYFRKSCEDGYSEACSVIK